MSVVTVLQLLLLNLQLPARLVQLVHGPTTLAKLVQQILCRKNIDFLFVCFFL